MGRLLITLTVLAGLALAFFGALADADPQTIYLAQTSVTLFLVICAVVVVTTFITFVYMYFFGLVGDRFARSRIHRFIGWKLLRSQRQTRTLRTVAAAATHRLASHSRAAKLGLVGVGLAAFAANHYLSAPARFNAIAGAVSDGFATALEIALLIVGAAFLLVGLAGLAISARAARPAPLPIFRVRSAVTLPTFISIVGVSIGIWALIVVLGVMHGLQSDLRDKILRTNAHLVIEPERPDGSLGDGVALERAIRDLPNVVEAHAFVHGEVMVSAPAGIAINVVIKGMTDDALATSEQLAGHMTSGGAEWIRRPEALIPDRYRYPSGASALPDPTDGELELEVELDPLPLDPFTGRLPMKAPLLPGALIGVELAKNLGVDVGMEIQLISPDGDIGPTGLRPKLRSFRVAGVFKTGMYEYDQKLAYVALDDAQRFFDYGRDQNRVEARLTRAEDAEAALDAVRGLLASDFPGLVASDWRERNKSLFSALQLERVVMFIILGFIILVASLLIVSSLVMLVVEKVKEIAVLKALGAADLSIVRAFLVIGGFIGGFGILAGVPLGVGTCLFLIAQGFTLPREFYITELPVKLDGFELVIIGLAALAICLLATLYPSLQASRLKPADGLRHG